VGESGRGEVALSVVAALHALLVLLPLRMLIGRPTQAAYGLSWPLADSSRSLASALPTFSATFGDFRGVTPPPK